MLRDKVSSGEIGAMGPSEWAKMAHTIDPLGKAPLEAEDEGPLGQLGIPAQGTSQVPSPTHSVQLMSSALEVSDNIKVAWNYRRVFFLYTKNNIWRNKRHNYR